MVTFLVMMLSGILVVAMVGFTILALIEIAYVGNNKPDE